MTTKSLCPGFRIVNGKVKPRAPRMAPVLARGQKHKADRHEAKLRANAAKSKGHTEILTGKELTEKIKQKGAK